MCRLRCGSEVELRRVMVERWAGLVGVEAPPHIGLGAEEKRVTLGW